jgi:ABC-type amino acid transport substrate-binding protein
MEDRVIRLLPHRFLRCFRFANLVGIVSLLFFALLPPGSFAQIESGNPAKLKVGAVAAPPFAMKTAAGAWEGLSIDLWQEVASVLGAPYEMLEYGTFEQLEEAVVNEKLDAAIGLAATEQREIVLDLSHPYFRSGSAIAVSRENVRRSWSGFIGRVEIARIISVIGVLILLWLIAGAAVWVFESHRNREMFGGELIRGLGHSAWWAAVTMTTVGYGDKAPQTLGGRIVAIVWMLASIVLIAGLTATISASLTAYKLTGRVRDHRDLPHVRVGSMTQSSSLKWLDKRGIAAVPFPTESDGLKALIEDRIDAFVFNEIVLRHIVKSEFPGRIHVLAETLNPYDVCMGMPNHSPLREPMNRALLKITETDQWNRTVERYIGAGG